MKIKCPNCGEEQDQRDLVCSNCGADLSRTDRLHGLSAGYVDMGGVPTNKLEGSGSLPVPATKARLNLHVIRSGQVIPLPTTGEYIVGRVSQGQSVLPDVDLEPYEAYQSGVSRLHARIHIEDHAIWITDLGSANGTRINNEKLSPHRVYPLSNKDVVRFGRLSIQALVGQD